MVHALTFISLASDIMATAAAITSLVDTVLRYRSNRTANR